MPVGLFPLSHPLYSVFPDKIDSNWRRKEGHSLCPEDLKALLEAKPELLIIGLGASSCMNIPETTKDFLMKKGIELIATDTKTACDEFNRHCKAKKVVAGLHLTC